MEADHVWKDWLIVVLLWGLSLGCLSGNALDFQRFKYLRLALSGMSVVSAGFGLAKARQIEMDIEPVAQRRIMRNDAFLEVQAMQLPQFQQQPGMVQPAYLQQPELMPAETGVMQLDPVALKKQNTGLLVCGSSGSAKTTMVRYCLPFWVNEGYQVIVLDPHGDRSNPEYPWADFPYVVTEHEDIFEQIKILMQLIKDKDKQKVICIADEWTDLFGYAEMEGAETVKLLRNFLITWGTGGRKFGKFLVGIGHTDNVEMWGLKGKGGLIRNFGLMRLGDIATRHAESQGKGSGLHVYCQHTAYPLLVGEQPYYHPTHGHYSVKENEQPPANIQPLNFHQLGFDYVGDRPINLDKAPVQSNHSEPLQQNLLNRLLSLGSKNSEPLEPVTEVWDGTGDIPSSYTAALVQGIRSGLSKNQIITELLLTPKGGSRKYKALSQHHDEMRHKIL